jgi:galactoside O-acetyltransferase
MTNPLIPEEFKSVDHRPVIVGRHAIVGCGSVILPGAIIGEGCAVAALSMVKKDCNPFGIYAGIPARRIRERSMRLLDVERRFHEVKKHD